MGIPFKMKGFSGFGNSPVKQTTGYSKSAYEKGYSGFDKKDWQKFDRANKAANRAEWKKVGRGASRIFGGLGVVATMHDMYKSGQKHSGGKAWKGQKTGVVTPKGDFWKDTKKKTKSIYKK